MKTIKLDEPVTVDGREVTELQLRKPKVRDIHAARRKGKTQEEIELHLLADLCEVPPDAILDLTIGDYALLQEAIADFLPAGALARMMAYAGR